MMHDALCKSHAVDVLVFLCKEGTTRFSDVRRELDLNPSVVDRRLSGLVDAGFVEKAKGLYRITDHGRSTAGRLRAFDPDGCHAFCTPDICLGRSTSLDDEARRRAGSWIHGLLRAVPARPEDIADAVPTDGASTDDRIAMAERWNMIHRDGEVYVETTKGRRVLDLLDRAADWDGPGRRVEQPGAPSAEEGR